MRKRTPLVVTAAAALGLGLALVPAGSASARSTPDIACMKAGISVLKEVGLFSTVAKSGLPISLAVSYGVTPRAGTDVEALPDPLPLNVVLADHRAGDNSLFIYPWCG
jgi:hypothetical protein